MSVTLTYCHCVHLQPRQGPLGTGSNPPFYGDLIKMGFAGNSLPDFTQMAAVTFVDTVVSNEPFTDRLLFHELVHIVQYEKLVS